jgi:hypothetical protein
VLPGPDQLSDLAISQDLPRRVFDKLPSAVCEAACLMAGRSALVSRRCCLRSCITILLIDSADGYLVRALDPYEVQND